MEQRLARRFAKQVAQIFNLPYRRIAFGRRSEVSRRPGFAEAPQITNLRYGRLQICATASRRPRFGEHS